MSRKLPLKENHWIKRGLRKEYNSLFDFRTWMVISAVIGIPYVLNIFYPINLQIVGGAYLVFGLLLFILQNYKKKEQNKQ